MKLTTILRIKYIHYVKQPFLKYTNTTAWLDTIAPSWTAHHRDWPRYGTARYEVIVYGFFGTYARGVGHTFKQAARRAERMYTKREGATVIVKLDWSDIV